MPTASAPGGVAVSRQPGTPGTCYSSTVTDAWPNVGCTEESLYLEGEKGTVQFLHSFQTGMSSQLIRFDLVDLSLPLRIYACETLSHGETRTPLQRWCEENWDLR